MEVLGEIDRNGKGSNGSVCKGEEEEEEQREADEEGKGESGVGM